MLLIDQFLEQYEAFAQKVKRDPITFSGQRALTQAIRSGEKIFFEHSTVMMLAEKLSHYEQTMEEVGALLRVPSRVELLSLTDTMFHRGTWIEFPKPLTLYEGEEVSALFCFVPASYLRTGKDTYTLYLITPTAGINDVLTSLPGEVWEYEALLHRCLFCTYHGEGRQRKVEPCQRCAAKVLAWAHIFALSSIIAAQYLASIRYEEKVFTGIQHRKREKSARERRIPTRHIFKVIDANEIVVFRPQGEEQVPRGEPRGSWLEEAMAQNDVEYREVTTRPYSRRYHTLEGVKEVYFPSGTERAQPTRKSLQAKRITKVRASQYEER